MYSAADLPKEWMSSIRKSLNLPEVSPSLPPWGRISYELYRALFDALLSIDDLDRCPMPTLIEHIISYIGPDVLEAERTHDPQCMESLAVSIDALRCYLRSYREQIAILREDLSAPPSEDLFSLSRRASRKSDTNFFRYLEVGEEWIVFHFLAQNHNDIELAKWVDTLERSPEDKVFFQQILTTYNKWWFAHPDEMIERLKRDFPDGYDIILIDLARLIYERDEVCPVEIALTEGLPAIVLIYRDPYAHHGEGVEWYFPYHESSRESYIQIYDTGGGVTDAIDHESEHLAYHVLIRSLLRRWELLMTQEQDIWRHIQDELLAYLAHETLSDVSEESLLPQHLEVSQDTRSIVRDLLDDIWATWVPSEHLSTIIFSSESLPDCVERIRKIVRG